MKSRAESKFAGRRRIVYLAVFALLLAVCCLSLLAPTLQAQVLITGENGGQGSHSLMVAANAIQVEDLGILSNNWLQYGHGLHERVDGFLAYGNIGARGQFQSYVAVASNIGLLRRSRSMVDVSLYNNGSMVLNRRWQACAVLLTTAVIASRPIAVGKRSLTLYGGATRLTPLGRASDPFFTPPSAVYTGIVGVTVPVGSNLALYVEYDPGRIQSNGGVGLLYSFSRRRQPETHLDEGKQSASPLREGEQAGSIQ